MTENIEWLDPKGIKAIRCDRQGEMTRVDIYRHYGKTGKRLVHSQMFPITSSKDAILASLELNGYAAPVA